MRLGSVSRWTDLRLHGPMESALVVLEGLVVSFKGKVRMDFSFEALRGLWGIHYK